MSYNQSLKILKDLKEKTGSVRWFNDEWKEEYGIIARKIESKDKLREKGFMAFDLEDWK